MQKNWRASRYSFIYLMTFKYGLKELSLPYREGQCSQQVIEHVEVHSFPRLILPEAVLEGR